MTKSTNEFLIELQERIKGLEHKAELIQTVLIVKEPTSIPAANAYDGLRKQIVAAAAERRSHLAQLVAMAVTVSRATSIDDIRPQVSEWMEQAGVVAVGQLPPGIPAGDLFEDVSGVGLGGEIEILEPAYVDAQTNAIIRLGRAQPRAAVVAGTAGKG